MSRMGAREPRAETAAAGQPPGGGAVEAAWPGQPGGEAAGGHRRRGRWVVAAVVAAVVLAAGAGLAWRDGVFRSSPGSSRAGAGASGSGTSTAAVRRRSLSSTTPVSATLGYAGSCTVAGRGSGTITWLPSAGQVISQGQVVYRVGNGTPVVLLYGSVPDWRTLKVGMTGADVSQLNHDLVALGYADSADIAVLGWDYFSWETRYGLERLQSALGESNPAGKLPLGQAVFEPTALRVTTISAQLGSPASGAILTATSTTPVVTIDLDTSMETEVKKGDAVSVTLPDGAAVPGVVSQVGTVATAPSSGSGSATIPVTVTLTHPKATGSLDGAPVTVNITTASVKNVLSVPVDALLARAGGGYAVEVVGAGGRRHLVPVTVGPVFDDAAGLVQVSGSGLAAGQHVVVPAT